ncbi:MAG: SufB/SufD family protein [Pseudomonadota bacterium]
MPMTARQKAEKFELAEGLLSARGLPGDEGAWAREAREAAAARLRKMGAPVRRDEYWKWTDPRELTAPEAPSVPLPAPAAPLFAETDALVVTCRDGVVEADAQELAMAGVEAVTLKEALQADIHWAKELFGVLEARSHDRTPRPLAAFNTAVAEQGLAIRVTGKAPRPILIRGVREAGHADATLHHVVKLEEGAELTLLETGSPGARVNASLEVEVADRARFHYLRANGPEAERRGVWHLFARLGTESVCKAFAVTAGGRLTRAEQVVELTGDDAVCHLAGACLGDGKDFLHDDTVFVTHDAERCESRQVFKKVLRSGARAVFQGKILVKEGAQKTDGYQISQGLLLDDEADFQAKPELEIYADDVECSHGSTCGAADEDALYYLRARGIPKREAENLLIQSFLGQAVEEIEDEDLAAEIRDRIWHWIRGEV